MILIADSGSTKTTWCFRAQGQEDLYFDTEGYNPYFVGAEYIEKSIRNQLHKSLQADLISALYFYGAGCDTSQSEIVAAALKAIFPQALIKVEGDILGAAHATLGDEPGFVAILGTGTNSCLYDGQKITAQIDSLGFILGDEGSGAYMGRKLVIAYNRGFLPQHLAEDFYGTYQLSPDQLINQIYTKPLPNRFCASLTFFIIKHIDQQFMQDLVNDALKDFFKNIIQLYPSYRNFSFNCVGSIAHLFRSNLEELASEFDMKIGKVLKSPIEHLVKYHSLVKSLKKQ